MVMERDKFLDDLSALKTLRQGVDFIIKVCDHLGKGGSLEPAHWVGLGMRMRDLDAAARAPAISPGTQRAFPVDEKREVNTAPTEREVQMKIDAQQGEGNRNYAPPAGRVERATLMPGHMPRASINQLNAPVQSGVDGDMATTDEAEYLPPVRR